MAENNGAATGSLDPLIHESSRLMIVSILNEGQWMDFNFLLSTTGFSKGNLSTHMTRLVDSSYVEEAKEFIERKPRTSYRLTATGRSAFRRYRKAWQKLTGGWGP